MSSPGREHPIDPVGVGPSPASAPQSPSPRSATVSWRPGPGRTRVCRASFRRSTRFVHRRPARQHLVRRNTPGRRVDRDSARTSAAVDAAGPAQRRPSLVRGLTRSRRTSSSVTCRKSQNDSPTDQERGRHDRAHNVVDEAGELPARTPAPRHSEKSRSALVAHRAACTAANMLAPVAKPSSTTMTILPVISVGGRSPQ